MIVEVASGLQSANRVPRDRVTGSLGDLQAAVRADPNFVIVGIRPSCGLHRVFSVTLDYGSADTHPN